MFGDLVGDLESDLWYVLRRRIDVYLIEDSFLQEHEGNLFDSEYKYR